MISIVSGAVHRSKLISLGVGLLGFAGCVAGWIFAPGDFFVAYLFAHQFFLGLSLGSLGLLMTHHLTGGYWGYSVRRFFGVRSGQSVFAGHFVCAGVFRAAATLPVEKSFGDRGGRNFAQQGV